MVVQAAGTAALGVGVNQGEGFFFFTTDELGVMCLLLLALIVNAGLWLLAYDKNKTCLARAFGITA